MLDWSWMRTCSPDQKYRERNQNRDGKMRRSELFMV